MKVKEPEYSKMKEFIFKVLAAFEISPKQIRNEHFFHLWMKTFYCVTYPDDNPNALIKGKRIIPQQDFPLYPCQSNDDSLNTAIRKIIKELSK